MKPTSLFLVLLAGTALARGDDSGPVEVGEPGFEASLPAFADPDISEFIGPVELRALHPLDASPSDELLKALFDKDMGRFSELLIGGTEPNGFSPFGDTPLIYAIRTGNEMAVKWLLEAGARPEFGGMEGQPALWLAWATGHHAILRILLEHDADPETENWAPAEDTFLALVQDNLLRNALKNDSGLTLLMAASATDDRESIALLLKHGAKANVYTNRYKRYPINYAAMNGHIEAMQLLLGNEPEPGTEIIISLDKQKATFFRKGEAILSSSVSTGKKGYRTPTGSYVVTNKHRDWTSTLYDASMPYFLRLSCGAIGLHAGNVPGYPASHGCIRLPYSKAREFFQTVPLGTKVVIQN